MNKTLSAHEICYADIVNPKHLWGNVPAIVQPLPKLVLQMTVSISINHGLFLILQYLQQPRIVADVLTAMVLSPKLLGLIHPTLDEKIFPAQSLTILETVANLGLLYAMFIKGLHVELTLIARKTTKTLALAYAVMILPFAIGCASYLAFRSRLDENHNAVIECIFWGSIAATTSFPTLAPFLPKLKLLCTDIGREALSMGMINGVFSWFLLFFSLALSASSPDVDRYRIDIATTGWVLLFMFLFLLICAVVIRPVISKMVSNVPEGENYSDHTIQMILLLVLACGLIADFIGSHFIFGAFVLGMCIPNGVASTLIEKMEDCVLGILMPLYFAVIGTRLDLGKFLGQLRITWGILIAVTIKAICTIVISFFFNMDFSDGMALGVLLSAKGLLPLVIANIARERQHLSDVAFTGVLLVILLSTTMVGPIMSLCYKRIKKSSHSYEQRTLEGTKPTDELRLITCIHAPRNVPSIINLLEITNITIQTPVTVYALHLVEQVGQAPAMLIEHASSDSSSSWGMSVKPLFNRIRTHSEQIITAFHEYEQQSSATAFIQTLTVVSPVDTMHEDICSLAENKQATLIILSFHKQQGVDGKLEDTNIEFRSVNQNVMSIAPCSVGLLVDRGLRMLSLSNSSGATIGSLNARNREEIRVAMVFIGGPDDREALAYCWRMAGHPFVTLTVIRFIAGENATDASQPLDYLDRTGNNTHGEATSLTILTQNEKEKQLDNQFLYAFQQRTAHDASVHYTEMVSNSGEETISLLRQFHRDFDLYVVGRGDSVLSPLTTGLAEWSDCPELGSMGDVLITSDFAVSTSVLVIQQHRGGVRYNTAESMFNNDGAPVTSCEQA